MVAIWTFGSACSKPHELAAAMSFPTGYRFTGNKSTQVKQIGNAVPRETAKALCGAAFDQLTRSTRKERTKDADVVQATTLQDEVVSPGCEYPCQTIQIGSSIGQSNGTRLMTNRPVNLLAGPESS